MIQERIDKLNEIFENLQLTNSYNDKLYIVNSIPEWLKDDFNCVLEVLDGKYVFGFKMPEDYTYGPDKHFDNKILSDNFYTIRDAVNYLLGPSLAHNLSRDCIDYHLEMLGRNLYYFLVPIVNKTLRLGIGRSLLTKDQTAPMLARKYEFGKLEYDPKGYFITEKLDGNRCIAFYWNNKWNFISRNGKPMHVNFDMTGLSRKYVYDGEVLSREQVELSQQIEWLADVNLIKSSNRMFNSTSGLINRHNGDKDLVYNIFDVQCPNMSYFERRKLLDECCYISSTRFVSKDVRIVPALQYFSADTKDLDEKLTDALYKITDRGGEGLMINLASADYSHKRTKNLLKYKQAKTMDMVVLDTYPGEGKYEGQVGGLICEAITYQPMQIVTCKVGTGLSDAQRLEWSIHPDHIINQIVEVEYFSLSQDESKKGSIQYSLRFPRLKKVRTDKNTTSIY